MPQIWRLTPAGTLAGTMRIPLDKADSGNPNDTVQTDLDDLLEFVAENLDIDAGSASAITSPDTSASVTALDDGQVLTTIDDVPVETVELAQRQLRHELASGRTVEVSIGDQGAWGVPLSGIVETVSSPGAPTFNIEDGPPTDPTYRYGLRVLGDASALGGVTEGVSQFLADSTGLALQFIGRAGSLINGFSVQGFGGGGFEASAGVIAQIVEGVGRLLLTGRLQVQTPPTSGTPDAGSVLWRDSSGFVRIGDAPVPTAVSEALDDIEDELADLDARMDDAEAEITSVSGVASGALPKPGGITTANGIVTGSGTGGAAVAVSTTIIADLVKRLGNVFTLSANTVLDDSYSGSVIFTDTSGGARQHTVPTTVSAGWNAVFVREGANTLKVIGDGTMLMKGPAAAANEVAIAVDDGGVSVLRRSATKCWCAGKIS